MTSVLGFKVRVDLHACIFCHQRMMDLSNLTSGATPANLLVASLAADPFSCLLFQVEVGCCPSTPGLVRCLVTLTYWATGSGFPL